MYNFIFSFDSIQCLLGIKWWRVWRLPSASPKEGVLVADGPEQPGNSTAVVSNWPHRPDLPSLYSVWNNTPTTVYHIIFIQNCDPIWPKERICQNMMDFKRSLLCFFLFHSPISCYRNQGRSKMINLSIIVQGGPIFINRNSSALILPFSPPISSWSPPASDAISQLLHPEAFFLSFIFFIFLFCYYFFY